VACVVALLCGVVARAADPPSGAEAAPKPMSTTAARDAAKAIVTKFAAADHPMLRANAVEAARLMPGEAQAIVQCALDHCELVAARARDVGDAPTVGRERKQRREEAELVAARRHGRREPRDVGRRAAGDVDDVNVRRRRALAPGRGRARRRDAR